MALFPWAPEKHSNREDSNLPIGPVCTLGLILKFAEEVFRKITGCKSPIMDPVLAKYGLTTTAIKKLKKTSNTNSNPVNAHLT